MSLQQNAQTMLDNLEFIKAAAAGKTVEVKVGNTWTVWKYYDFTAPSGSYRIKREPIVQYLVVRDEPSGESVSVIMCPTLADAERCMANSKKFFPDRTYRVVELREVVKE